MKTCTQCRETKPLTEFYGENYKTGMYTRCKTCNKAKVLEWRSRNPDKLRRIRRSSTCRKHGISSEVYDQLIEKQDNLCAICRHPCESGRELNIDHDHRCCPGKYSCGKCIRGLLCVRCNQALGKLRDDPALLRVAAEYLERTTCIM